MTSSELFQPDYHMVTDSVELNHLCEQWQHCSLLALDTEFIRTKTYFPQLGLLQLSDGNETWLIDPLAIDEWSSFKALMLNSSITKIFHSCSEDLLVFIAFFGLIPTPLYDTQIAATLLNKGLSLSYQNLVKNHNGIELPKGETRSDWMQRPLTKSQLDYAALDVIYLPEICQTQQKALADAGKDTWAEEEFNRLQNNYESEFTRDFSEQYLAMKGGWQFSGEQMLALKLLCEWREFRTRDRDRPRNWILRDNALYEMAETLPTNRASLAIITDVSSNFVNYEGDKVLAVIARALDASSEEYPAALPKPLTSAQKKKLQKAKEFAETVAAKIDVPVEYLGRRKTLVKLIQSFQNGAALPEELGGWRGEFLVEPLQKLFTEQEPS